MCAINVALVLGSCTLHPGAHVGIEQLECALNVSAYPFSPQLNVFYTYRLDEADTWQLFPSNLESSRRAHILYLHALERSVFIQAFFSDVSHNVSDDTIMGLCEEGSALVQRSLPLSYAFKGISLRYLMSSACGAPWIGYIAITFGSFAFACCGLILLCRLFNVGLRVEL